MIFYQKQAYVNWLNEVSREIRNIDQQKALILDLPWNKSAPEEVKNLSEFLPVDAFGLAMKETPEDSLLKVLSGRIDAPIIISSLPVETFSVKDDISIENIILENWQDERYSQGLSFTGLLDFSGRKKKEYFLVEEHLKAAKEYELPEVKILKPAVPLLPGGVNVYHAMLYENGNWKHGAAAANEYHFEWKLVKNDIFGNSLAAKDVGLGHSIALEIPQDYEDFQLLLSAIPKGTDRVIQTLQVLHTPIYSTGSY